MQVKVESVNDAETEFRHAIMELPLSDKLKAIALSHYRKQWLEAEKQLNEKIDELKKQHFLSILPLQKKSNEIIIGKRVPDESEILEADQYLNDEERNKKKEALTATPMDNFWSTVLLTASCISDICSEEDLNALKSLKLVESEFDKNSLNFKIKFEFDENEYFDERVLEKEYIFSGKNGDHPIKTDQTKITWKKGKDLTKKILKKKQRNKKTGQSRIVEKEVASKSFFQFFSDKIDQESDEELDEKVNQSKQHKQINKQINKQIIQQMISEKLKIDYDIGQQLIEEVIPGALDYYLGIQKEQDDDMDDLESHDFDQQDEDEDNDE